MPNTDATIVPLSILGITDLDNPPAHGIIHTPPLNRYGQGAGREIGASVVPRLLKRAEQVIKGFTLSVPPFRAALALLRAE